MRSVNKELIYTRLSSGPNSGSHFKIFSRYTCTMKSLKCCKTEVFRLYKCSTYLWVIRNKRKGEANTEGKDRPYSAITYCHAELHIAGLSSLKQNFCLLAQNSCTIDALCYDVMSCRNLTFIRLCWGSFYFYIFLEF
jgi:hypothetical protein